MWDRLNQTLLKVTEQTVWVKISPTDRARDREWFTCSLNCFFPREHNLSPHYNTYKADWEIYLTNIIREFIQCEVLLLLVSRKVERHDLPVNGLKTIKYESNLIPLIVIIASTWLRPKSPHWPSPHQHFQQQKQQVRYLQTFLEIVGQSLLKEDTKK